MSEAEKKRRAEYKVERKKKILIQAIVILAVLLLVIASTITYFQLNKNYFIKKFRDIIGMTPYEYITELRIGTVKTLSQSGLSVIEASERAGFSTTASYYRAVKNSKG